jgi:hypothetical protein
MAVLCASPLATRAQADPLTITQGSFNFGSESPGVLFYDFAGEGFEFGRLFFVGIQAPLPAGFQLPCQPNCVPGEHLSFSNQTNGIVPLGHGPVTIDGTAYPDVQLSGTLRFLSDGAIVPPFASNEHPLLRAPFSFDGTIVGLLGGEQVFAHEFRGSGTAHTGLFSRADSGDYILDEIPTLTYTFSAAEPVPEPATLLLVGTSLALGLGRRKVWRRKSRG